MIKKFWPLVLLGILIVALVTSFAPEKVRKNDTVTIHYTLTLEDGTVYDSTIGREPLTTTLGQGTLIPSFEAEVIGMQIGESKKFTLPAEKAYGAYRPDLVGTVDRTRLPQGMEPEIGKQIQANLKDGTQAIAVITSFTDTTVTLDANHPLAGETLTFDIKLMGIGENGISTRPNQMVFSWLILALGVTAAGFVFFNTRNRRRPTAIRVSTTSRRLHK